VENNDCHAEARCRVLTRAGIETWHCCVERHPADLDQASDLGFSSPITRRNFSGSADGTPATASTPSNEAYTAHMGRLVITSESRFQNVSLTCGEHETPFKPFFTPGEAFEWD